MTTSSHPAPAPTPASATTPDLLRQYQSGTSDAPLRELISRYLPLVHATARRRTGSESLAADVAQTVLIDFARQAKSLPPTIALGGWLLRHTAFRAARALRTEIRRAAREAEALRRAQLHPPAMPDSHSPPGENPVSEALHRLPAREQSLLVLKFYDGLEIPAIAAQLGISPAAAQKRTERALHHLRRLLPFSADLPKAVATAGPSTTATTTPAVAIALTGFLSRSAQAAAIPSPLPSKLTAAALTAARQPMPWPLVRFRHMGPWTGSLTGIAAALALSAIPLQLFQNKTTPPPNPAVAPTSTATAPASPSPKTDSPSDIADIFSQIEALVAREGRNRVVWPKIERLLQNVRQEDSAEAIVRIDGLFPTFNGMFPNRPGPDRWIRNLLYRWQPASVSDALQSLLPRLSPRRMDSVAMDLSQNWFRKSPVAATAWLHLLMADHENLILPEPCRQKAVMRMEYQVQQELLVHNPQEAGKLAAAMKAGGFQSFGKILENPRTASANAAQEAILERDHPWYQPVKEVLDEKHTPSQQRALAEKIGDPGVRMTLAKLLCARNLNAARQQQASASFPGPATPGTGNSPLSQITAPADWLLGQCTPADRTDALRTIIQSWPRSQTSALEKWIAANAPEAIPLLDQEKSRTALSLSDYAPNDLTALLKSALSITDPALRDYTLAACLVKTGDKPAGPTILDSPDLPPSTANSLREWLALTP